MAIKKSLLIAVEGLRGSGKTTFAKNLYDGIRLKNKLITQEPTSSIYGNKLRKLSERKTYTPERIIDLAVKDRVIHIEKLRPAIKTGSIIIFDKYYFSDIAYEGARGLPIEWIEIINRDFPNPDLTFYLDCPVEQSIKRIKDTNVRYIDKDKFFLEKVKKNFEKIFFNEKNVKILNSNDSPFLLLTKALTLLKKEYNIKGKY